MGRQHLEGLLAQGESAFSVPTAIISITDPDRPKVTFPQPLYENIVGVLQIPIWDTERIDNLDKDWQTEKEYLFGDTHIAHINMMMETWLQSAENLIVHCEAGLSRSVAIAEALSRLHDIDLFHTNETTFPNSEIFRLMIRNAWEQQLNKEEQNG